MTQRKPIDIAKDLAHANQTTAHGAREVAQDVMNQHTDDASLMAIARNLIASVVGKYDEPVQLAALGQLRAGVLDDMASMARLGVPYAPTAMVPMDDGQAVEDAPQGGDAQGESTEGRAITERPEDRSPEGGAPTESASAEPERVAAPVAE